MPDFRRKCACSVPEKYHQRLAFTSATNPTSATTPPSPTSNTSRHGTTGSGTSPGMTSASTFTHQKKRLRHLKTA